MAYKHSVFTALGCTVLVLLALIWHSTRLDVLEQICPHRKVYHPSPWESWWRTHVDEVADSTWNWFKGCERLTSDDARAKIHTWMATWQKRDSWTSAYNIPKSPSWDKSIFSYHEVIDCTGKTVAWLPLEPLVGFLRHPEYICLNNQPCGVRERPNNAVNKDYMFPAYSFETFSNEPNARALLFDLGASTYNSGPGGASQSWFIDTYRKRGIEFERIFDWEGKIMAPDVIFEAMPPDVIDKTSYFNILADTTPDSQNNPLRVLKAVAKKADFVVFKVDIDNNGVELEFMKQILADPEIFERIDEFYFEHHVLRSPMTARYWGAIENHTCLEKLKGPWGPLGKEIKRGNKVQSIVDSYELFSKLRELGIRAHSWV